MGKVIVKVFDADEVYCDWYRCTCGCGDIMDSFKFCPRCGSEIDWDNSVVEYPEEE